jgi:deoxyadenosine/deoxycytidine kinase
MPRVAVLGNVGSGKSELSHALAAELGWTCVEEPVERWRQSGFLSAFYGDPKRLALGFQCYAFATRRLACSKVRDRDVIWDSHVAADPAFVAANVEMGNMTPQEAGWYAETYEGWEAFGEPCEPDLYLYLRCAPATCARRVCARDRLEESGIEPVYLEALDRAFEALVPNLRPLATLDAGLGKGQVLKAAAKLCRAL